MSEGETFDSFTARSAHVSPRQPLGYDIVLDDFSIEWYEPKYLLNTFQITHMGGDLLSSLNVEKKKKLTVAEAGVSFEVLRFSEDGVADGLMEEVPAEPSRGDGAPPYPVIEISVENHTLRMRTRDEPEGEDRSRQMILYSYKGTTQSVEVEEGKAYRLENTPPILRVLAYYPDFKIDKNGPYSVSDRPVNPTISIKLTDVDNSEKTYGPRYLFGRSEFRGMGARGRTAGGSRDRVRVPGCRSGGWRDRRSHHR